MAVSDQAVATGKQLDQLCINTIRTLSMDAVQKANSGHPGTPMALAPVAYSLWQQFLRYDPADPHWPNRDRFILSNGHASMLLYSLLYLTGVREVDAKGEYDKPAVSLDDIKAFRQIDSKTPGHPESSLTTGVETTTGPLGQGVANSVGFAIAERWLAGHFNRPGFELFGYNIWAILRRWRHDGRDFFRGRFHRGSSASFQSLLDLRQQPHHHRRQHGAGLQRKHCARFEAYGWDVNHVRDANDLDALSPAPTAGRSQRPAEVHHR